MTMTFNPMSWWHWSGKHQERKISKGSSLNPSTDSGLRELETFKFPLDRRRNKDSSSRKVKQKGQSQEKCKIDKEYDIVLVPSDGGCVSESESDDLDWSIGWLEPHGPSFQSDKEESDDSFAVLVPCYRRGRANLENNAQDKFLAIGNFRDIYTSSKESKRHVEQWLSSLGKS